MKKKMTGSGLAFGLTFLVLASAAGCAAVRGKNTPAPAADGEFFRVESNSRIRPTVGTKGMVVADDSIAAKWGAEVLRKGGNAVDAAVATGFALAVTRPHFAALGGGGFMVFCPAPDKSGAKPCTTIDYRETAPAAAFREMYIRHGKGDTKLSQEGALAPGVPGVPGGLLYALEKYGSLKRGVVLETPIRLAQEGVPFTGYMEATALEVWDAFNPEGKRLFGCSAKGGAEPKSPCEPGMSLRQPDLAKVLEEIRAKGRDGFYEGWVAEKIAAGLKEAGGIMTEADLAGFHPKERKPVVGSFRGFEVVSMGPPSAGGAVLLQMLKYVDIADAEGKLEGGYDDADTIHVLAHAMSLGFADRAELFGDPDYVKVPVDRLLDQGYLQKRWDDTFHEGHQAIPKEAGIRLDSLANATARAAAKTGGETTHYSVVDKWGNAVAVTVTVNNYYGSGFVPPGTGIVMNDEMDDFAIQPGVPNMFGLVGAEANSVAAGKRPLSSMSPTVVRDAQGNARLVLGAAGGPTITTSVFQAIVNRLRFGMTLPDAVAAPRFHTQWKPPNLRYENGGLPPESVADLQSYGWEMKGVTELAQMHALERFPETGRVWGCPDRRADGAAAAE
ncbi:MAG TPA: gamma-glutamyltransferase [Bdellovibrionota bacterium]|jgi:gamma-glutamyltranspeptidase/glutathione hydrolase|nr:gamma-glutamyltransferase [Bdellovibrionota bacterium]